MYVWELSGHGSAEAARATLAAMGYRGPGGAGLGRCWWNAECGWDFAVEGGTNVVVSAGAIVGTYDPALIF